MTNDQDRQDDVTRLIREGRRPEDLKGRMQLAVDKLSGDAPLGVDAPNKTVRKVLGGGGSLLAVLNLGIVGVLALVFAALFIWGAFMGSFDVKMLGYGAIALAVAALCLRKAWRTWRTFKAIVRA
jgi:hypothetical protein